MAWSFKWRKNFAAPFLPTRLTAPAFPRMSFPELNSEGSVRKRNIQHCALTSSRRPSQHELWPKKNSPSESNDNERDLTTIRHESNCPSLRPGPVNPLNHPRPKRIKNRRVQNIRIRLDGAFWRTSAGAPNGSVPRNICSSANSSLAGRSGKNNLSLEGKCCQE